MHSPRMSRRAPSACAIGHRLAVQLDVVAPGIFRLGSGARRIFVLGLGEQPIRLAGGAGEPFDISLRVVPADVDRRPPAAPPTAIAHIPTASATGGAGVPLVEGQRELRHREGLCDRHLVRRALAVKALTRGRAHQETPRRHDDHFRTIGALLEGVARLESALLRRREGGPLLRQGLLAQPFLLRSLWLC